MRFEWKPYVPVAKRRAKAERYVRKLEKKRGYPASPITIEGRKIARTFWGKAWCDNLENYSDFSNRLPRGRTYARNGSVVDLQITQGKIEAIVGGSDVYQVKVDIKPTPRKVWKQIQRTCAGSIDSLLDLLQGRFDESVMSRLSRQDGGLFPTPNDIEFSCSCPDWAYMCKHVAAVLCGVGARLDEDPEMLFLLRGVDHRELTAQVSDTAQLDRAMAGAPGGILEGDDLGDLFGIDLDETGDDGVVVATRKKRPGTRRKKKSKPNGSHASARQGATSPKTTRTSSKPTKTTTPTTKKKVGKKTAKAATAKKATTKTATKRKRTAKPTPSQSKQSDQSSSKTRTVAKKTSGKKKKPAKSTRSVKT